MKEKKKAQGTQPNFVGHDVEQLFSGFHFSIKVQSFSILLLLRLHTLSLATQKLKIYIFSTLRTIMWIVNSLFTISVV